MYLIECSILFPYENFVSSADLWSRDQEKKSQAPVWGGAEVNYLSFLYRNVRNYLWILFHLMTFFKHYDKDKYDTQV